MRVAISALSVKPDQTGGGETVLRNLLPVLSAADPAIGALVARVDGQDSASI